MQLLAAVEEKKDSYFGSNFESNSGETTAENIASKELVGLFFSASWCPPCKAFFPILVDFYKEVNYDSHQFEVFFLSQDEDEAPQKEYFEKMPWRAIKFKDERIAKFKSLFGVTGIPKLVVLTPEGALVTKDGRTDVVTKGENAWLDWVKAKQELVDAGKNVPFAPVQPPQGASQLAGNPSGLSKVGASKV